MRQSPLQVQLSADDFADVKREAERKGLSVSALVRAVVRKYLNGNRDL